MATCKDCLHYDICTFHITGDENKKCLHFASKADVAEVKHGEWIDRDGKTWCSLCNASNKQYKPPYYPHCGAKMDGGKNG